LKKREACLLRLPYKCSVLAEDLYKFLKASLKEKSMVVAVCIGFQDKAFPTFLIGEGFKGIKVIGSTGNFGRSCSQSQHLDGLG
jgi:hypothetical protein